MCVENEFGQNTYIVEFEDCCVIIDAGINIKNIKSITNKPITAVFITHGHFDHIKNIEDYDELNVPIYANKHIIEMLRDENKNASKLFNQFCIYKVENLKFVQDAEKIKINEHTIKCLQTKGHSIDGVCFLIDDEMLFSGDTLFADSVGRTDLPTGNTNELIKSLNLILNLDYKTLYSGHGRPSVKEEQKTNIPKYINYLN
jgi:glyoxylase-like metal-dependent hydrolase (beta-lactamase superfamily II)